MTPYSPLCATDAREKTREQATRALLDFTPLPTCQQDAILLGSGLVGAMIWQSAPDTLRFEVARADVYSVNRDVFQHRKPIGHCLLKFPAPIQASEAKLNLFTAEATLSLTIENKAVQISAICHALTDTLMLHPIELPKGTTWEFVPEENPQSSRARDSRPFDNRPFEPPQLTRWQDDKGVQFTSTHYRERGIDAGELAVAAWVTETHMFCQMAYDRNNRGTAKSELQREVDRQTSACPRSLLDSHRENWADYMGRTHIELPDKTLEIFTLTQLYKLRAMTKPGGAIIDLQAVWFDPTTPWPAFWHNLNSQLTYWLPIVTNRLDLMDPLINAMTTHETEFARMGAHAGPNAYALDTVTSVEFVPHGPYQAKVKPLEPGSSFSDGTAYHGREVQDATLGNFLWLMHNIWLTARFADDETLMQNVVVPFLRNGIRFYEAFLVADETGALHLPETFSPEYKSAPDCTYDLAVLRWALKALFEAAPNHPDAHHLSNLLLRLPDYAWDDETGYLIGNSVELTDAHRHYSHLLMAYPFYDRNLTQEGEAERIRKSIAHWQSFSEAPDKPHPALVGYSFTGAASLYASIGDGDAALTYLQAFMKTRAGGRIRMPNTQYYEHAAIDATTVEVPLTCAVAICDMLLQSWGGTIRVFPAIPGSWKTLRFDNLLAEGGIAVSAELRDGKIRHLALNSRTDRTVRIEVGAPGLSPNEMTVDLQAEQSLTLVDHGDATPN